MDLIIIGAGGHGKVVADAAEKSRQWQRIVFVDRLYPQLAHCGSWPVVANEISDLTNIEAKFFVAIGDNNVRAKVFQQTLDLGYNPATVVHPHAQLSDYADVEPGVLVLAGCVINAGAKLCLGSIINTGSTVDHDCSVGEFVHLSPGVNLAGEVNVGKCTWLGTGVSTKQCINIGPDIVVGVGAAVVSDLVMPGTYIGVPAKILNLN